jgi:colicin import membrane protein
MLHTLVFGSLFVAFDLSRTAAPPLPLSMKATLVSADSIFPPPVIRRPEPDLVQPEPERVQPDPAALRRAEDEKRRADARREQERLDQLERVRLEARLERERERRRQEMEEERLRDIEQQRQDNILEEERLMREAQDAMIAAEEEVFAAEDSIEARVYQNMIVQKVRRNWARPGTARDDLECIVAVQQVPGGVVVSARVMECNGDDIVRRSVENAVHKASPLPQPSNPLLFLRTFQITFTIED